MSHFQAGADISTRHAPNVFHLAIRCNQPEIFRYLLSQGLQKEVWVDPNDEPLGFVALAAQSWHRNDSHPPQYLVWLLEAGLDPDTSTCTDNYEEYKYCGLEYQIDENFLLLEAVFDGGSSFDLAALVVQYGADVNGTALGQSALSVAHCDHGYYSPTFVRYLVDAGVNLWYELWRNKDGDFERPSVLPPKFQEMIDFLNHRLRNPASLLNQCRIQIRTILKRRRVPGKENLLQSIDMLKEEIPEDLLDFLRMEVKITDVEKVGDDSDEEEEGNDSDNEDRESNDDINEEVEDHSWDVYPFMF